MTKRIDPKTELTILHNIYTLMRVKVEGLNHILVELIARLEHSEDEEPPTVLKEIKAMHSSEKIEALMGELVDLYHYEQLEAKNALTLSKDMAWKEYQAWMKEEVERVSEKILPQVSFLKEYDVGHWDSYWGKWEINKTPPFRNTKVEFYPHKLGATIPVAYRWEFSPVYLEIQYLKEKTGSFRKRPVSTENFNQAKFKKPIVQITICYTNWIAPKTVNQVIDRLKAAFQLLGYDVIKVRKREGK